MHSTGHNIKIIIIIIIIIIISSLVSTYKKKNIRHYKVILCNTLMRLFSAPEICNPVPGAYGTKSRHQKMESIDGAGFWRMCHGYEPTVVTCFYRNSCCLTGVRFLASSSLE